MKGCPPVQWYASTVVDLRTEEGEFDGELCGAWLWNSGLFWDGRVLEKESLIVRGGAALAWNCGLGIIVWEMQVILGGLGGSRLDPASPAP